MVAQILKETATVKRRTRPKQTWVALAHCYRTISSLIEGSFTLAGLSLRNLMLLEALLHKGPVTITQIQASVLPATGSMTAAVDRLEARGFILRSLSAENRRVRVLELKRRAGL